MDFNAEKDELAEIMRELEGTPKEEAEVADLDAVEPRAEPEADDDVSVTEDDDGILTIPEQPAVAKPQQAKPKKNGAAAEEQRTVPVQALHAERARIAEMRKEMETLKAERERYLGEVNAVKEMFLAEKRKEQEAQERAKAEAARPKKMELVKVPSWEEDPAGYAAALNQNVAIREHNIRIEMEDMRRQEEERARRDAEQLEQLRATVNENVTKYQQNTQQQQQQAALYQAVNEREQMFAAAAPDYWDAINAYKIARVEDYEALGLPTAQAQQAVMNEMQTQARQFLSADMDPAQSWYALASRRGFAGGSTSQKGAMAAPKKTGRPSISTRQRGMASSEGLATAAQAGGGVAMDTESLMKKVSDMSDKEFMAFEKSGGWDKLMSRLNGAGR